MPSSLLGQTPHADTQATSLLVEDFVRQFPGISLPVELAESFFPTQLRETLNILLQLEKTGFEGTDGCGYVTAPPRGAATHIRFLCASSATVQEESF